MKLRKKLAGEEFQASMKGAASLLLAQFSSLVLPRVPCLLLAPDSFPLHSAVSNVFVSRVCVHLCVCKSV